MEALSMNQLPASTDKDKDKDTQMKDETGQPIAATEGAINYEMEFECNAIELTFAQEEGIKKEVLKRLKKERNLEGGIRLIREKSAFHW